MSKLNNILLATVFAASAPAAFATCTSGCGTTPTGTNQTTTVGVNPTQISNVTQNAGDVKVGVGVDTTTIVKTGDTTNVLKTGDTTLKTGDTTAKVGDVIATTGPTTATVEKGAVANSINYSTTYKAAASTAMAAGVIGAGHGCFEHKGGVGIGVQALTFGVSGNVNQGENYNKECANDQVDLAIISKGGDPVSNTLAAETAAARSENVRAAIGAIPTSPLLGLYAQFQPVSAPVAAAAPIVVKVEPTVVTTAKPECSADKPFNPKTGKCGGDIAPAMR